MIRLKLDCLNPISSDVTAHPSVAHLNADVLGSREFGFCSLYALTEERCVMNAFKGMNEEPTSLSIRCSVTECGMT